MQTRGRRFSTPLHSNAIIRAAASALTLSRLSTLNSTFLFPNDQLTEAIADWESSHGEKGEIFTKPEVVQFMLDVSGLDSFSQFESARILEPSCGHGDFLLPIAQRLVQSISDAKKAIDVDSLADAILAFDIVKANVDETRSRLRDLLTSHQLPSKSAIFLADKWVRHQDFLQADIPGAFTHVLGNPPYVRVEAIPKILLDFYRSRFSTMTDRADLYIPFFEKSLALLEEGGQLCFICTDRWTKNQYGRKLRSLISKGFSFDLYTDLYGEEAFQAKVLTYPAITLISRKAHGATLIYHEPQLSSEAAQSIRAAIISKKAPDLPNLQIRKDVVNDEHPWLFGSVDQIQLVKRLERTLPTIEEAGCNVYIGAATGNNDVFIIDKSVDIEDSRKLPVISASEIRHGQLCAEGRFIINTYDEAGVIELNGYPKLEKYLNQHKAILCERHVAKNSPTKWHKTIDRVHPSRARKPKLLIPDIKSELTIVFDPGKYHPNNSIYYICSDSWNLHALKAVLTAGIGNLFVQTYTTKVAGGNMRFQAQHLRRIRIPLWNSLPENTQQALIAAGRDANKEAALKLVADLFKLSEEEKELISV